MKERPILFSAPMVRALLDGTKTQTRRVVKPSLDWVDGSGVVSFKGRVGLPYVLCPYGQPGDRLWVRESWFQRGKWLPQDTPNADADDVSWCGSQEIAYAANVKRPGHDWRSRPSIHMPRWASRITLEITGVRVERLQDISEADAWAEGCQRGELDDYGRPFPADVDHGNGCTEGWDCAKDWYADLWESINGPASWDANPWVWAVEFKRVTA